jgi:hypothetical protein
MVSKEPEGLEGAVEGVGGQFFNELQKRELGRKRLLELHCTHFLLMDCDEFYLVKKKGISLSFLYSLF